MSQKEYIVTVYRDRGLSICTREEWDKAAQQAALKRAQHRENFFGALMWLAFLWLMGAMGAMENDEIGLAVGAVHSILALAAMALCAGQAHAFYGQGDKAAWKKKK